MIAKRFLVVHVGEHGIGSARQSKQLVGVLRASFFVPSTVGSISTMPWLFFGSERDMVYVPVIFISAYKGYRHVVRGQGEKQQR